jgi:hypothetical protein
MTDKILVVTPPDDTPLDGIRVLHVQLTEEQRQIVSSAMLNANIPITSLTMFGIWAIQLVGC